MTRELPIRWRDLNHPHLHLRELDPALADDWVSLLREQVDAGLMKPWTVNPRIAAISSLNRWAAEPSRSAVKGVPLIQCHQVHFSTLTRAPGR